MFESLEPRRLFTVTVVEDQGTLLITGTEAYDSLFLSLQGETATVNGVVYEFVSAISYQSGGGDDYTVVTTEGDGTSIAVHIDAGDGNDTIDASESIAPIDFSGGAGDDFLVGSSSTDTLSGGDGNDIVLGMLGTDTINTGAGNDYISGGGQMDHIVPPNDGQTYVVTVVETYPGMYEITGDDHHDIIDITVSMGDSTFTLSGTTYANVSAISVKTNGGSDSVRVHSIDGPGSISAAIDLGIGHDNASLNFDGGIWGGPGMDTLSLTDSFRGIVDGNEDNDTIKVNGSSQEVYVLGGGGDDLIDCSLNSFSVRANGGSGNDSIIGSPAPDELYGDDGDDKVYGLGGADMIDAGSGFDYCDGGNGNDIFLVDSNWTVIGGLGIDTVYAYVIDGGTQSGVERVLQR
jgi:Ca2+-binding RTX toxin-like protein